jgi:predicted DCC family thiol-disulfide oxidoreductase YuxK/uncharacterized membrane protein YphA (DoxX/SURF4 family)
VLNYVARPSRSTPFNLAAARVVLVTATLWKLVRYDWGALPTWPAPLRDILPVFRHPFVFSHVQLVALACGLCLLAVLVGYRLRATAWAGAILLTYLGAVRHAYQTSHTSRILFNAALVLLLFALFAEEDRLSVDQLRRTRDATLASLRDHLELDLGEFPHRALRWTLVVVGVFYFQAGYGKLVGDPVSWVQPWNLGRYVAFRAGDQGYYLAEFMLAHPPVLVAGAVGTIFLEVGLLVAVVLGFRLWAFLAGLVGMHAVIAVSVGPVFADQLPFLALLLPWDSLQRRLQRREELVVVYDRHCLFCARTLHPFRYLDVAGSVSYYSQETVPDRYDRDDAAFDSAMYAFRDGDASRGYAAFRQLFAHLGITRPVGAAMALPGVRRVGRVVYGHVARNRSRHFACGTRD